jgi:hypothetical protein
MKPSRESGDPRHEATGEEELKELWNDDSPEDDFDDASDLDEFDPNGPDDECWEVFLADDEWDPLPEHNDFWIEDD